jgi:hypothetical protein
LGGVDAALQGREFCQVGYLNSFASYEPGLGRRFSRSISCESVTLSCQVEKRLTFQHVVAADMNTFPGKTIQRVAYHLDAA